MSRAWQCTVADPNGLQCRLFRNHDGQHGDGLGIVWDATPKPKEPTGLGAVVEDAEGRRFVLHNLYDGDAKPWCDEDGVGHDWAQINAVKVLSGGVTS